jgi:integrase
MPAAATLKAPKLSVHKASGQAYVYAHGQRVYLGRHDDPETRQAYHRLISQWAAFGGQLPAAGERVTVKELVAQFWVWAEGYYRTPSGEPTTELSNYRQAFRHLKALYADTPVADFGPTALQAVRQSMIEGGWSRSHINQQVGRIKTLIRWGTERELVPGNVYHAVQALSGLKRGRCAARETEPVRPAPIEYVNAIQPFVSAQVWALIQLQLLTGARAGELVVLRPCDINTGGRIWTSTPEHHKTAHHGLQRTIYFGPRAQAVLNPFLTRATTAPLFSPLEAEEARREKVHARRKTPMSCGNRPGLNKKHRPRRPAGEAYDVDSYRRAIARGCDLAFPPPEPLARREGERVESWRLRLTPNQKRRLGDWQKGHRWHPHQLRHNAATELRKEFGIEIARIILGHRSSAVTEIYAELDAARAVEAMSRVG